MNLLLFLLQNCLINFFGSQVFGSDFFNIFCFKKQAEQIIIFLEVIIFPILPYSGKGKLSPTFSPMVCLPVVDFGRGSCFWHPLFRELFLDMSDKLFSAF